MRVLCVREKRRPTLPSIIYNPSLQTLSLSPPTVPHHYYTPKMSINHFSSDLPEAHWWSHYTMASSPAQPSSPSHPHKPIICTTHHNSAAPFWLSPHHLYPSSNAPPMFCNQNTTVSLDLNIEDDEEVVDEHVTHTPKVSEQQEKEIPQERLFEKPLTPSDVGKLNRLVIPKQHAEKHFPLTGGADSCENGLLLGFEDEVGKSWRFRYSYWNSSQSYVLTKGWSRFVKEKRLDAGDIVIFARHRVDTGRFFIGWRRRNSGGGQESGAQPSTAAANGSGGGGWSRAFYTGHPYQSQQQRPSNSLSYQHESIHAGGGMHNQTSSSSGSGNSKRVRLFGVDLECQADDSEPSTPVGSPQGQANRNPYHQQYYSSNHHMGISFSGAAAADVYRQG